MLSLSKLSALASGEDDEDATENAATSALLDSVEHQLNTVAAQEQLPSSALEAIGLDRETMRVLTPREILELYIGDENKSADPIDFKKALDLLEYVRTGASATESDADLRELRLHIFARALLRDDWARMDVDNPLESVRETVFFRLTEFCYLQGEQDLLETALPSPEDLFARPELKSLKRDANFKFLVKSGYEHIARVCGREEADESQSVDDSMQEDR